MISAFAAPAGMLVFAYTMVSAGLGDLTTMKIRNGLVLSTLAAYALLAPFAGFTAMEIGLGAAAGAATLAAGIFCFARGWIGGGDAKLTAVTVLWLGPEHVPAYFVYAGLFGGALTLLILQFRAIVLPPKLMTTDWIARLHAKDTGIPYGVALSLAALAVFPHTRWMTVIL